MRFQQRFSIQVKYVQYIDVSVEAPTKLEAQSRGLDAANGNEQLRRNP
jgi:hypothetical protein